jgi:hypothetical protein
MVTSSAVAVVVAVVVDDGVVGAASVDSLLSV